MEKVVYNKLVRDNIPDIIRANGDTCEVSELSKEQFKIELQKKVGEEAQEIVSATDREMLLKEIVDLTIVLDILVQEYEITSEELSKEKMENLARKGGFEKRLYLKSATEN